MIKDEKTLAMSIKTQLLNSSIAFAMSVTLGAGIPVLWLLISGNADPFQTRWPLYLHATACLAAFAVSLWWRQRAVSAIGLFVGLVGYVLIVGKPEYPAASVIAVAIHGFLPAIVGAMIAFAVSWWSCRSFKTRHHA